MISKLNKGGKEKHWGVRGSDCTASVLLSLLIPETELFVGDIVGELVAFAAALDAALVGATFACGVTVAAVLEQAGVPLQTQAEAAGAGLPHVSRRAARQQDRDHVHRLGQDLKHGALHSSLQPMFDVPLPGVDSLPGLAAHVVDVAAELPSLAQVHCHVHGQLVQAPPLLRRANGLRVFLSESGHGLAGDELIVVEVRDEAQGLVLALAPLQLPKDERPEDLHMLFEVSDKRYESSIFLFELKCDGVFFTVCF